MRPPLPSHWWLILIIICNKSVDTKRSMGALKSDEDFVYLDRFCFQSDTGSLEYSFKYPLFYPTQMLLFYYDTPDQWPRAYKELTSCSERVEILTNKSENNQIIFLDPYMTDYGISGKCKIFKDAFNEPWVHCMGTRIFRSARSRWWFLALANCVPGENEERHLYNNESIGIYVDFTLQMTNGLPSEFLKYQFSIDEWSNLFFLVILPSDTIFICLQFILIIITYIIGVALTNRRLYHNTFRMCAQSIVMNTVGLGLLVTHYTMYALDGMGFPVFKSLGSFIRAVADMLFVYMILVLSRGLNVTKMRLTMADKCFLSLMVIFFFLSYLFMQFCEIRYFNPAEVISETETLPGYFLGIWRIVAWIFFVIASCFSADASPPKRLFFSHLVVMLTPWFWAPPVAQIIANFALNSWVRAEVANIANNIITFYGYLVFLWLARPTDGNQNFPFHIRTTQVDVNVGFDPNIAYTSNPTNVNDGMHGTVDYEMSSGTSSPRAIKPPAPPRRKPIGTIERPQIS
ncbi:unnamed protein product [Caenorhabditis bovis]|uniref:Intimal thickness related receptor IRP domain-containing protein n=1 Tax=Caenorhabditis bovis TaxID=2654633 RepID=A0A8S1ESZ9_9PELO|nr:unnamed protein product [Caenorhabditis bovis]